MIKAPEHASKTDDGHSFRLTAGFGGPWSNPNPDGTLVPDVIRTYRVLLTRGLKGCYVFVNHMGTRRHIGRGLVSS